MKIVDRRTFLKGMGVLGGTALGLGALNPFKLQAQGSILRYGLNSRDARRLDPMAGPNSSDKTV
ncbi:MAG: twin-arginine translocation signal domain-containing protein, partial [Candidatus Binatia bacterium]